MKISIITINYNNVAGLESTIQSVIKQHYKLIEYIVIDGGSNDGSADLLLQYQHSIDYWVSEKDTGIYNAMNKGIKASSGDYLLFLNSGDRLINSEIINWVVEQGLTEDVVYGDLLFFDDVKDWTWHLPNELTFQTFYSSAIAHPSTFIKKQLFNTVGLYDERLKIVADWKFLMLAVAKHNCTHRHINQVISAYSFDGVSSKPENMPALNEERKSVLEEEFPSFINDYEELRRLKQEIRKAKNFIRLKKVIKGIFSSK